MSSDYTVFAKRLGFFLFLIWSRSYTLFLFNDTHAVQAPHRHSVIPGGHSHSGLLFRECELPPDPVAFRTTWMTLSASHMFVEEC